MLDSDFVYFAVLLNLVGAIGYLVATIQGRVRPNRVTWFMWAVAAFVAFAAELDEGVGIQALMTLSIGLGPALIFLASFVNRDAYWRLTRLDITCGVFSGLGLALWMITQNGVVAIVLAIVADALATVPTLIKAYRYPRTESSWAFWCGGAGAAITILTIDHGGFAHYGFPVYIMLACGVLAVLITFRIGERAAVTVATAS